MRRLLAGPAAVLLLLTAACNGNDDSGSADTDDIPTTLQETTSSTSSTSTPANEQTAPPSIPGPVSERGQGDATQGTVEVKALDFAFDPTYIRATAGARVTVSLRNDTATPHTFTMAAQDVDQQLEPGSTAQVTVSLPQDGPVVFVCRLHEAQGMKGAFYYG
jgi:plastocyanin